MRADTRFWGCRYQKIIENKDEPKGWVVYFRGDKEKVYFVRKDPSDNYDFTQVYSGAKIQGIADKLEEYTDAKDYRLIISHNDLSPNTLVKVIELMENPELPRYVQ